MTSTPYSYVDPAFTIDITPWANRVEMTLRGLWTPDTCTRFEEKAREIIALLPSLGCVIGEHVTLIDVREFAVQQKQALDLLTVLAGDRSVGARRRAVLNSSALVRAQMRRTIPEFAFFSDRAEALVWLAGGDEVAAATSVTPAAAQIA